MPLDVLWVLLTILSSLAVVANAVSLAQGLRFGDSVRKALRMAFGAYLPRAAVLVALRGIDENLDDNLRSILSQRYPAYRILAIADEPEEPAFLRLRELALAHPRVPVDEVVADSAGLPGKANALRTGLRHLSAEDEAVVFADADIRPGRDWLRQLMQPLADASVGVATGFRWYAPARPTFWSVVRSEWNAVSANAFFDPELAFAWGGSAAVRTEHLPKLGLETRWQNVLSDDLILTEAVRAAGLRVAFVPSALSATLEGCDRPGCFEWCFRQMAIATLYRPALRRSAAGAFAVFNGAVILGVACVVLAAILSLAFFLPAALFLVTLPATVAKAMVRRNALLAAAPSVRAAYEVPAWKAGLASLLVPWLMAWGLLRTRRPAFLQWKDRMYDVRDPWHVRLQAPEDLRGRR